MTAPVVPQGWTQAAADLVWEDWLGASRVRRYGETFTEINGAHMHPSDPGAELDREMAVMGFLRLVPEVPGSEEMRRLKHSDGYYVTAWASRDARLRAWAAVGAPVFAPPAEGDKPGLAEWVAACDGSALGRPLSWWDDGTTDAGLDLAAEFPGRIIVYLGPGTKPCVEVQGAQRWEAIATPAELRACLDRLAAEARS